MPDEAQIDKPGMYRRASAAVDDWLRLHEDERFDVDMVCRQLEIHDALERKAVTTKLYHEVQSGRLEKTDRIYRVTNTISVSVRWWEADETETLDVEFPWSHDDETYFKFRDWVVVSPGDVHVLAGVSNMGKTTYAMNFVWENMFKHHCLLMGSEYAPGKFKRRANRMSFASPFNGDGQPIFELIERHAGWKDVIQPDSINVIDWINLDDNFYSIGGIIEGIKTKLRKGMALIVLQKSPGKELGLGGGFGLHMASLYLSVDFNRLTVVKAKEWNHVNPNNTQYRFTIVEGGSQFHDIHQVRKCLPCGGSGKSRGQLCDSCDGKGVTDVFDETPYP